MVLSKPTQGGHHKLGALLPRLDAELSFASVLRQTSCRKLSLVVEFSKDWHSETDAALWCDCRRVSACTAWLDAATSSECALLPPLACHRDSATLTTNVRSF